MILKLTNLWYAVNIDVNGHYAIYGVSAGEYQLEAFAPGYVVQSYNGHTYQGQADTITVGPGDNLTINFSLNPGASSISGTVRSADGVTPVPNAKVTAYTADTGLQAFGGLANANGEYIIDGLPPGDYKVEATSNDRSEWYQDKPHIDQADKVTVSALGNTPGINFTLEPAATTSTATGTGVASFTSDAGTIENLTAVAEGTLTSTGKPNLVFPHGFFSFNITGLAPGQTVVVTITLPSTVPVGTTYWKYHTSEGGWIQIPMGDDDGDSVITITLVDGGLGDNDGAANGVIVDPGGPGFPPPAPAMSVGGIAVEFPVDGSDSSSPPYAVIIGGAMAVLAALALGIWFARRRWLGRSS